MYVPCLDAIGVARGDVEGLPVGRESHAARPLTGRKPTFGSSARTVEDSDVVGALVGHENDVI
jgi:hypothetical protein